MNRFINYAKFAFLIFNNY